MHSLTIKHCIFKKTVINHILFHHLDIISYSFMLNFLNFLLHINQQDLIIFIKYYIIIHPINLNSSLKMIFILCI